jgi:hypothetical protein
MTPCAAIPQPMQGRGGYGRASLAIEPGLQPGRTVRG